MINNCQIENRVSKIHEETNTRIYDRNIPSQMLQPYLDVRPVMTKYSYFPIVDPRKQLNVPLVVQPTFNPHTIFNPGNTQSPWSGGFIFFLLTNLSKGCIFTLIERIKSLLASSSDFILSIFNSGISLVSSKSL